jgi:hypothetical protein
LEQQAIASARAIAALAPDDIHDSIFTRCLGSVPFPRFGDYPPGGHFGQDALTHFRQN